MQEASLPPVNRGFYYGKSCFYCRMRPHKTSGRLSVSSPIPGHGVWMPPAGLRGSLEKVEGLGPRGFSPSARPDGLLERPREHRLHRNMGQSWYLNQIHVSRGGAVRGWLQPLSGCDLAAWSPSTGSSRTNTAPLCAGTSRPSVQKRLSEAAGCSRPFLVHTNILSQPLSLSQGILLRS